MTGGKLETANLLAQSIQQWAPGFLLVSLGALAGALAWVRMNSRRERSLEEDLGRHLTTMFAETHFWGGILLFAITQRRAQALHDELLDSAHSPDVALRILCQQGAMPWGEPCWLRLEADSLPRWVEQTAAKLAKVPLPDRRLPRAHSLYALVVAAARPLAGKYTPERLSAALAGSSEVAVVACALPSTAGRRRFSQQVLRWLPWGAVVAAAVMALLSLLLVRPLSTFTSGPDVPKPGSLSMATKADAAHR